MKTPLAWISLYAPLWNIVSTNSIKKLAHEYSIHTAEIDGIEEHFLDKVVVGKVISCEKHPDSKKLSIVEVAIGNGEKTTILTWAANISEATYVPVALVGAVLPGDFTIGERMMAGMMSRGMICSDDELGLATERAEGIMVLEHTWKSEELENMIGKSFFDLALPFVGISWAPYEFTLRDTTFEIDNKFITNRPDLFSVYGNAREWHTVFGADFHPYLEQEASIADMGSRFQLDIQTEKCFAYNAWKMENISVRKSPWWMSLMMERAWLNVKMDIVDITNCIMTEVGQPMHAFDADKISWWITVRMAKAGEKLLALNGVEYALHEEDMVIADQNGPVALAGVIWGMDSAVSLETKNIIWESACFDPISVRLTAQRHGIRTDASTRYEKSLDPLLTKKALIRVVDYMKFLGKDTTISASASYVLEKSIKNVSIELSYEFLEKKIGITIPKDEVDSILKKLGFEIQKLEWQNFSVRVPSWRATKDISIKEDIAEEVGRVYWYDHVVLQSLGADFSISEKNVDKSLRDEALSYFSHKKWNEVYNYSFTNKELDKKLNIHDSDESIAIRNAFNEEYTHMRRSLAGRLFENLRDNARHSELLRFFEIGNIYSRNSSRNSGVEELLRDISEKPFSEKKKIAWASIWITLEQLRKDIEGFFESTLGFVPPIHQDGNSLENFLHPWIAGRYVIGDDTICLFWQVHPWVAEAYDINVHSLYFEIDYTLLLNFRNESEIFFQPISRFQSIRRELNFVVDETTRTWEMKSHISSVHPWIRDIYVDSVYRDEEKVGTSKKSVNFSFLLVSDEDTISDKDALEVQENIIAHMKKLWYTLRS